MDIRNSAFSRKIFYSEKLKMLSREFFFQIKNSTLEFSRLSFRFLQNGSKYLIFLKDFSDFCFLSQNIADFLQNSSKYQEPCLRIFEDWSRIS